MGARLVRKRFHRPFWPAAFVALAVACGAAPLTDVPNATTTTAPAPPVTTSTATIPPVVVETTPTTTTASPVGSTTTDPPPREPETFGWDPAVIASVGEFANASLAVGPLGWLLGVSEDSREAPELWFSTDGSDWTQVAELPITRSSIGAPVIGVGTDGMVAIKVGDPESAAWGEPSELAVWSSNDGLTWVEGDPGGFSNSGYLYDLEQTDFGWLAVGESYRNRHDVSPAIYHSDDGKSWQRVLRGDGAGAAWAILERDGQVLVVGSDRGRPTVWRSSNGTKWRSSRLQSATHGGEATAGAWLHNQWVVVGTGSETEAMSVWTSPDGADWDRGDQLLDPEEAGAYYSNRFGSGDRIGDALVVGARMLRFAHENFCFEGDSCFVTIDSILVTNDGTHWSQLTPPPTANRYRDDIPVVTAGADGLLITVTQFDGSIVVWTRPGTDDARPYEGDPPVPELTIERAQWGQDLDLDVPYAWVLRTHCGIAQLGEFNGQIWQLEEPQPVPPDLHGHRGNYGVIELTESADGQVITFSSGDVVVLVYYPRPLSAMRFCM